MLYLFIVRLITIFDCAIDLKWDGTASDGSSVSGRLKIPEVSHETAVDGSSDYTVCRFRRVPCFYIHQ